MRIEVQLMLLAFESPQDNDIQICFDVTASANVRVIGKTWTHPGESLVADIEIDDIRMWSIHFGTYGANWPEPASATMAPVEAQRRLDWMNSVLDDREDWRDRIIAAVLQKYELCGDVRVTA